MNLHGMISWNQASYLDFKQLYEANSWRITPLLKQYIEVPPYQHCDTAVSGKTMSISFHEKYLKIISHSLGLLWI